ncbi:MAG: phosphogluconate dehydrogenase (NAD(+)-dependent, decarboxylating) [Steroidobacter sp.]
MQVGMIGLGRMGANMARRLMQAGHECVVYDAASAAVEALSNEGARGATSVEQFVSILQPPRAVWLMLPAAVVGPMLQTLTPLLARNDVVVDGGNSEHRAAINRARELSTRGISFIDVGTSGGVWGLERGYCLMIGGDSAPVARLQPVFEALTTTVNGAAPSSQQSSDVKGDAPRGYLHCGAPGAGHFVKMIHNAIEYALMAAYAEGFNLLAHAGLGGEGRVADAETAPLGDPEAYRYDFDVPAIAELWRNGSVIRSWLLDLTASALKDDPRLDRFAGRVSDSGEGRWALKAAVDLSVPAPTLANALFARFSSRDEDAYANRLLSAMREQFGGHAERAAPAPEMGTVPISGKAKGIRDV